MNSIDNAKVANAVTRGAATVCLVDDSLVSYGSPFIHVRMEEQAQRSPLAVAVAGQDRQLTYEQLNCTANELAWKLIALGAGPDTRVGVLMGRSSALIVALIAILKAGAAYVPLDPDYPVDRLRFMLQDTGAQLLVTEKDLHQKLCLLFEGTVIAIEEVLQNPSGDHQPNPLRRLHGDNLAYVTYTSGSTGRPKAVGVRHGSAAKFVSWSRTVFRQEELAGVLFATSVCFDLSIFEIFVPLSAGGQVIVAGNVLDLTVVSGNEQITLINTVPSLMAELLHMASIPRSVRVINLAGEALSAALLRNIRQDTGIGRIFNLYGPSECTTYSTFAALTNDDYCRDVPIGAAIDGTHCYVLNHVFEPVANGEEGELFIGGDGVARGYINRPDLTAQRFLPDPFARRLGQRMYRTGDLVRQRPDGSLIYSGRADFQIKLRGYRIELGEIESVLEEDAAIERAIVMLLGDAAEDKRLVAFVVMKDRGNRLNRADLRARLRLKLPDYMLPGAWVELQRLPMTLNGKVDRSVLARLEHEQPGPKMEGALPWSATERSLASIWTELLQLEAVSVEDDFFALGGHSLTANRMLARIAQDHGVELSLKDIFTAPTLKDFSALVEAAAQKPLVTTVPLKRLGAQQAPLSYPQEMLYIDDQIYSRVGCYNVAESFRITGPLNIRALQWALAEVVRRHEALRTRFVWQGDDMVQWIEPPDSLLIFAVCDLTAFGDEQLRQRKVRQLQIQNAREVFHLDAGGLLRAMLLHCGPDDYRLVITVHHIATDGWGQSVMRWEIGELYRSFGASSLPELPIQYADYAVWQRSWLNEARLQEGLDYWTKQLAGVNTNCSFAQGCPALPSSFQRGAREQVQLDPALTSQLKQFCVQHGVTPFMLLLSALNVLLYRTTASEDIAVGTALSDRRPPETERLIGNFTNTVVLRSDLSGNPKFCDLLHRVARTTLDAQQHRYVPYQDLVKRASAHLAHNQGSFFQVMLVLENIPNENLQLGQGLMVTPEPFDIGTSVAPFVLSLMEQGNQFTGHVEYYLDLFNQETIRSLFASYKTLLRACIACPDHTISHLALLPEAGQHQVITLESEGLGSLDRTTMPAALEKSAARRPNGPGAAADAPQSETECRIIEVFMEVLKRDRVGRHDSFLDLGGHSLSAIRAASRLSALFVITLPARSLFDFPTPAGLATVVEQLLAMGKPANSCGSAAVVKSISMEQILATLDTLSEDEVELLLEQFNKKAVR